MLPRYLITKAFMPAGLCALGVALVLLFTGGLLQEVQANEAEQGPGHTLSEEQRPSVVVVQQAGNEQSWLLSDRAPAPESSGEEQDHENEPLTGVVPVFSQHETPQLPLRPPSDTTEAFLQSNVDEAQYTAFDEEFLPATRVAKTSTHDLPSPAAPLDGEEVATTGGKLGVAQATATDAAGEQPTTSGGANGNHEQQQQLHQQVDYNEAPTSREEEEQEQQEWLQIGATAEKRSRAPVASAVVAKGSSSESSEPEQQKEELVQLLQHQVAAMAQQSLQMQASTPVPFGVSFRVAA
ncbi:unnamed protein product [Amoebophrya sp. A120]|nr:unnamed protein product [Amoebophrya sp. A120]|eukprot:GSA120T00024320001.1